MTGSGLLRHWRTKALLQKALAPMPGQQRLNHLLQTRVTRNLPVDDGHLLQAVEHGRGHLQAYQDHASPGVEPGRATFFEFGAGWDLRLPVALFGLGVGAQVVVDLTRHARPELVDDVVARLARRAAELGMDESRLADAAEAGRRSPDVGAKAACFGISYRAPCDARATGLAAGSVDCVTSTSTLEHIPPADIPLILAECRRILRPGGVASFVVDHSDHYSHFDPKVTPYNFLAYSDRHWRIYNSALHYQNRMRHSDYVDLVRRSGLEMVDGGPAPVGDAQRAALDSVRLAPAFSGRDRADLAVTRSHMILRA